MECFVNILFIYLLIFIILIIPRKEIQKWEEKMIKSGNRDLVRRKSLMDTNTPTTGTSAAAKKKTVSTPATAAAAPAKSTRKDA